MSDFPGSSTVVVSQTTLPAPIQTTSTILQTESQLALTAVKFALLVDEAVEQTLSSFLRALSSQVEQKVSQFKSSFSTIASADEKLEIAMSLADVVGQSKVDNYIQRILPDRERTQSQPAEGKEVTPSSFTPPLTSPLLQKVAMIFGPVTCQLLPFCVVNMDRTIGIQFIDASHLGQVEQFLCDRILGNEATISADASDKFPRYLTIGTFSGENVNEFLLWLNEQLYPLIQHLPTFRCSELQCRVRERDRSSSSSSSRSTSRSSSSSSCSSGGNSREATIVATSGVKDVEITYSLMGIE
mmetsp:Transcript_31871/g.53769  ORF Transcript_31871/g.53769 Transcript_31871/m.53769 type:complete len:299 (-) Transcript_31871:157-1053(-)